MHESDFVSRHNGPTAGDTGKMLRAAGAGSVAQLINETVPANIRLKEALDIPPGMSEHRYLEHVRRLAGKNKIFRSYIGAGYYDCITPAVIQRNILENPGWYTAYTPYQAEIAQGRLEALLNFQTMVCDLTAMPLANASLLDEATAAAEAMIMLFNARPREQEGLRAFAAADTCLPQTLAVLQTRAEPLGIELVIAAPGEYPSVRNTFGMLHQYPAVNGALEDCEARVREAHGRGVKVCVAADLLSLALLKPPGEWGADVVVGSSQRFGVPVGYGGPHAAFFATTEEYKRHIPGRIIGVSVDAQGNRALRMALQTREQHIRRERATSNICTSQVLLANMAGMYAVYHGPEGIRKIAARIHSLACLLNAKLAALGFVQENNHFFDTLCVKAAEKNIRPAAEKAGINFRYDGGRVCISLDETTAEEDVDAIAGVFGAPPGPPQGGESARPGSESNELIAIPDALRRTSAYLTHPVFNTCHSETEIMRYIKRLENRDLSLTHSMIALGSCTMKLNAAAELMPVSFPGFARLHPFAPAAQAEGYAEVFRELEEDLRKITGFHAVSLQPNSGAQGEYAGLMVIRAFHKSNKAEHRNVALIPSSAHGTNPASAVMAGMKVVIVKCDERGNIDVSDLKLKAETHRDNLAALLITYPSTHGVFEDTVTEITGIIHDNGGQVYMDGANMNAQVGLTNPAAIGADVCHLNLHKTFAIPHGGGGPGMGPICVAKHLAPFLPSHPLVKTGGEKGITAISAAPWGSASINLISYGYIRMLGGNGLTEATQTAILNANYLKARLEGHYPVLYSGANNRVAHEMILDCRPFKRNAGIEVEDIAKRLIDYGFHAPTVSFPVAGTLMIEPTESESLAELDRFCQAMISIREEIKEIEEGRSDRANNVLVNAPHTAALMTSDGWDRPYSREKAAWPMPSLREAKYWPPVSRVDNAYGDRNLICTCTPVSEYEQATA